MSKPLKKLLSGTYETEEGVMLVREGYYAPRPATELETEMARRLRKLDERHQRWRGGKRFCPRCEHGQPCPDRRILDGGSGD